MSDLFEVFVDEHGGAFRARGVTHVIEVAENTNHPDYARWLVTINGTSATLSKDAAEALGLLLLRSASIDRDELARVIHESGPCDDGDCTDPGDRGYCDKRADRVIEWLMGGEPRG